MPEFKEKEFNSENISEELLSLVGIWKALRNLNVGQRCIIHFKNKDRISGKKVYFEEDTGIIALQCEFNVPILSTIETDKPQFNTEIVMFRYRMSEVIGVGTFPEVKN